MKPAAQRPRINRPKTASERGGYISDPATGEIRIVPPDKLLQRLPGTQGRAAALREIQQRLAVATVFFQHHGDGGRHGVYRAVMDVYEYFVGQGVPQATLKPLAAVAAALVDADKGVESPIFKPDRGSIGGKPPAKVDDLEFDGYLAVVAECCVQDRRKAGERPYLLPGCELAARMIKASKLRHDIQPLQLQKLRERVQAAEKGSADRIVYENLMDSDFADANPLAWAKLLLAHDWVNRPPSKNP